MSEDEKSVLVDELLELMKNSKLNKNQKISNFERAIKL